MPRLFTPAIAWASAQIYETRLPLSDNRVHYGGQIIGLVVADTLERARDAAHLARVEYQTDSVLVEVDKAAYEDSPPWFGEDFQFQEGTFETGDFSAARAGATTVVEATYTTETELNSPMEPHAIVAHWQTNNSVVTYEPTQWVRVSQGTYAQLLGIPTERVRVVSPYVGGAFGAKAFPWPHGILCVAAAREIQRPLKVVVSRRQMTANTGHRSQTEQTVRLATNETGRLMALEHTARTCTSPVEVFSEPCTAVTPVMYATPNLKLGQELAVLNVGTPTFMRAPGEAPGMFALESAMDELAWELGLDPVELRLQNETQAHQRRKHPFSAKYFADCLRTGAEQFGWSQRQMQPRSQQRDNLLVGWGMAAATFPGLRGSAEAKVRLLPDETAHVLTSANDMGTGSYTVIAMIAAETLGLPVERVRVEIGDSIMPDGGLAGGSQMTATLTPAVVNACQAVLETAAAATVQQAFASLQATGRAAYEATGTAAPGEESTQFAFQSWGAHFCEVTVDEAIAQLRITRWVSVMNVGRVLNVKTAASQIRGGIIMGIGSALMEE
ncbi:MAG: xanthine dehydrogenase family protein molybdopterin-binding subunit [Leptolyngbyaceae cyanobacterium]